MKKFKTKVAMENFGIPSGVPVLWDDDPNKDNTGVTGKLLCALPAGGSLFYSRDELEEVSD